MNRQRDIDYFVRRMFASLKAASMAADGFVKLVHLDFAGRYSIAATELRAAGHQGTCDQSSISASSFATDRRF